LGAEICKSSCIDGDRKGILLFIPCFQISKFGGDPNKVTLWGMSAGAGSVLQHFVANGGKTSPPLFRGGITSSTFLPSQYYYNDRIPEVCSCH
jgi:carboxylesterase family protein